MDRGELLYETMCDEDRGIIDMVLNIFLTCVLLMVASFIMLVLGTINSQGQGASDDQAAMNKLLTGLDHVWRISLIGSIVFGLASIWW